jgi:hypothetical protein
MKAIGTTKELLNQSTFPCPDWPAPLSIRTIEIRSQQLQVSASPRIAFIVFPSHLGAHNKTWDEYASVILQLVTRAQSDCIIRPTILKAKVVV